MRYFNTSSTPAFHQPLATTLDTHAVKINGMSQYWVPQHLKVRALFCLLGWHPGLFPTTDTTQISYEQAPLPLRQDYSQGCKSTLLLRLFSVHKAEFSYRKQPGMDREQGNSQHALLQTWSDESWNSRSHLQQPPIKFYMSELRQIAWSRGQQACWYPDRNKHEESSHFVEILRALQKIS